jgi:hypothetical protein
MVEFTLEHVARLEYHGRKIELRISDSEIVVADDCGQSFKAPTEVWDAVSKIIATRNAESPVHQDYALNKSYPNQGQPWTESLDERLTELWNSGAPSAAICTALGRNMGGISSRLVKLGIVNKRQEVRKRKSQRNAN